MYYRAVAATCPGSEKEYNSNNVYLNTKYITDQIKASEVLLKQKKEQEGLQFYALAEGFGAERYPDEASLIAIKKLNALQRDVAEEPISENYDEAADVLYSYLESFTKTANDAVTAKAEALSENIYASVAVLGLYETAAITCNLGNTRIYLFRKGNLSRLSEDHNQAEVMYKNGVITQDKVATHPKRNKLTQYLGVLPDGKTQEPYYSEVEVKHGDIFVICSGSYCSRIDDSSICEMVKTSRSLTQIAEKLMQAAASVDLTEDTSVVIIRADEFGKAAAGAPASAAAIAAPTGTAKAAATASSQKSQVPTNKPAPAASKKEHISQNKESERFSDKFKRFLGFGADSENEKIWPALLTFGCCILVVIVLTVLGIKIYRSSKSPSSNAPTNPPSANIGTPMPGTETPTPPAVSTPTPTGNTETPTPTQGTTQEPTAPPTIAPTSDRTQEPTSEPTQAPTEQPTQEPTQAPTEEPTQEPTQSPTEAPTEEPTQEPTQAPTEEPTIEPTPDVTQEPDLPSENS